MHDLSTPLQDWVASHALTSSTWNINHEDPVGPTGWCFRPARPMTTGNGSQVVCHLPMNNHYIFPWLGSHCFHLWTQYKYWLMLDAQCTIASLAHWKVIWGHIMTASGHCTLLPITFDRKEIMTGIDACIFRLEVYLPLRVQCRNIYIFALACFNSLKKYKVNNP